MTRMEMEFNQTGSESRWPPNLVQQGDPTGELCPLCGMEEGTHFWKLCATCRRKLQKQANSTRRHLRRIRPDWYPAQDRYDGRKPTNETPKT